jgi:hypothetical protein
MAIINQVIRINDVMYNVLHVLPAQKSKEEAETAVRRYSQIEDAILIQARSGQWVVARKAHEVIFRDINGNEELLDTYSENQESDNVTSDTDMEQKEE